MLLVYNTVLRRPLKYSSPHKGLTGENGIIHMSTLQHIWHSAQKSLLNLTMIYFLNYAIFKLSRAFQRESIYLLEKIIYTINCSSEDFEISQ